MFSGWTCTLTELMCLLVVTAAAAGAAPATEELAITDQRLWVEHVDTSGSKRASVESRVGTVFALPASVEWDCVLHSEEPFDHVVSHLTIETAQGKPLHEGSVEFNVREGANPFRLTWSPEGLSDGTYRAELRISWMNKNTLAQQEFRVRQISRENLGSLLSATDRQLGDLAGHLARVEGKGPVPPYPVMRLAVAKAFLPRARRTYTEGDWRRAEDDATFIQQLLTEARVELAFTGDPSRLRETAVPAIQHVTVREGSFFSNGRPVFLVGGKDKAETLVDVLPLLRACGLNLAVTAISPADTLPEKSAFGAVPSAVNDLLAKAEALEMGITVRLVPDSFGNWTYNAWPAMVAHRGGTFPYDVNSPHARTVLDRHMDAVLPSLNGHTSVVSVSLADGPEMQFSGEPVRQGLIELAKTRYGDRETMNRIWETLYLDFEEVQVKWDYDRPAYRHDLEVYQQKLGTEFLTWLAEAARQKAPKMALQVNFADGAFRLGESAFGVDREAMARVLDISGCEAREDLEHPYLALGYPSQSLYYTLLRSFNPQAPVFNAMDSFHVPEGPRTGFLSSAAHTLLWEGAMAGLCASAVPLGQQEAVPGTLLESPQRLTGYAEACLDLNRLALVVTAFQRQPAGVSIFWSMPSKIYKNGDPYLASVWRTYEGCHTFGYAVDFVSEEACIRGALDRVKILVIPDALSLSNEAFQALDEYIAAGGVTIRLGKPMPYTPSGMSRQDGLSTSVRTILVRGLDTPESYLHALDAACALDGVEQVPRAINAYGYPLEGVKSRFAQVDGVPHLYIVNLRKNPETVYLTGPYVAGQDLIGGDPVKFPMPMEPLNPLLVRLDEPGGAVTEGSMAEEGLRSGGVPSAVVEPIPRDEPETKPVSRPAMRHGTR